MPTWLVSAPTGPQTGTAVIDLIINITNWMFVGFMLLAVIFLVLAGLQFITSQGDPTNVSKAKWKIFWAVIGIGVALLARGIPVVVARILGVQ